MAHNGPMDVLRDLAEQTLNNTTSQLGKVQQTYRKAMNQLQELENYELEYQQQFQGSMADKGMSVTTLIVHQSFISSLRTVVKQHNEHVKTCQNSVNQTMQLWRQDKRRLNSFETLQSRAESARLLKENRLEQKMMDEFAQRAGLRSEML
ncbi:MAG: flagellar export protein FliJ [Kluyvera sp.]